MFYSVYIAIVLVGIFFIFAILRFLVKKKLNESNALLWLCIGVIILLAGLFPGAVVKLSNLLSITYPPALVFTGAIIILLFIVFKNSMINSEITAKVQEIAMEIAILEHQLSEKENELEELKLYIYSNKYLGHNVKEVQEVAQISTRLNS